MSIIWRDNTPNNAVAVDAWRNGDVLAIKDPEVWVMVDVEVLRGGREDVEYERQSRGPWQTKPVSSEVRHELTWLHNQMQMLFNALYGNALGPPDYSQFTWRPTITRGNAHKDKEKDQVITAFLNADDQNRQWKVEGEEVNFPPKCLWIFQAEKVEHQVVYGRCCVQMNWHLLGDP